MSPSYRVLKRFLTIIPAIALFLLISANPLAQSNQLPAPSSHLTDFAGVIDSENKSRLEQFLEKLRDKSKLELYVVVVDNTGTQQISDFSKQLARDWNIGAQAARNKSLLLVIAAGSKTSFTQYSRMAQLDLPEGVLGEMSYRIQGPLTDGRFAEAVESGVRAFASAVADKVGFKVSDLEPTAPVVAGSSEVATDSQQPVLVSTRPRVVSEPAKSDPQPTPPGGPPRTEPSPSESPAAEPTASESPKTETKTEPSPAESPQVDVTKTETANTTRKKPPSSAAKTSTPVTKTSATKKTAAEIKEEELDEIDEVELTLTKPLAERAVKLKEFLETHPNSKARPRAIELLISTHAALGDQKLKNGDTVGGIEQLLRAIDEADVAISDKLFTGVISQIPINLYLRGERTAAFQAAQNVEAKFGSDPKRLLEVAGFYLGIERASDTVRIAQKAITLAPDLAEAHRMLAVGLHISLRLDEAAAEYKKTLELDPKSVVSRGSLADLYRASGKTEEALALYNDQLAVDPKNKAAQAGRVISLFELSRTDEASSALEAALTAEPNNLPLLSGTAYWLTAHDNHEKAFDLARKAIAIEPRYTWAQIALARSLLGLKRPLDAERALRFARQYGKFPTLTYELANVLSWMGLYEEAAEVLRESFTIKDGLIQTYLAGTLPASESGFLELLAPERRAGIYQATSADSAANAKTMKALLTFNNAITVGDGEKVDESTAVAAAKEFVAGSDSMRTFRQVYAASRLLRNAIGATTALELIAEARSSSDEALKLPVATLAAQADEFRDLRASAITAGNVPYVAQAPPDVLANIFKGRLEDLEGWALFNQEKYSDALTHLRQAEQMLPKETPAWRTALWHKGVVLEQSGQKEQALEAYIKSYRSGPADSVRRSVIEQLYKRVNGSLDGLNEKLGLIAEATAVSSNTAPSTASATAPETNTTTAPLKPPTAPDPVPTETPKPEPTPTAAPAEIPKSEPTPTPTPASESSQPMSDEELRNAASRLRSTVKITGRLVDANKVGIANATVVLISPSGTVLGATTDNEGYYSFKVAASQKSYRLIPSKEGYTFAPLDRALSGLFEDLKEVNFVGTKP